MFQNEWIKQNCSLFPCLFIKGLRNPISKEFCLLEFIFLVLEEDSDIVWSLGPHSDLIRKIDQDIFQSVEQRKINKNVKNSRQRQFKNDAFISIYNFTRCPFLSVSIIFISKYIFVIRRKLEIYPNKIRIRAIRTPLEIQGCL